VIVVIIVPVLRENQGSKEGQVTYQGDSVLSGGAGI
jgi:hypothetical protein